MDAVKSRPIRGKSFEKAVVTGLSVGYVHNPPWIVEGSDSVPSGVEARLVKELASESGIRIV